MKALLILILALILAAALAGSALASPFQPSEGTRLFLFGEYGQGPVLGAGLSLNQIFAAGVYYAPAAESLGAFVDLLCGPVQLQLAAEKSKRSSAWSGTAGASWIILREPQTVAIGGGLCFDEDGARAPFVVISATSVISPRLSSYGSIRKHFDGNTDTQCQLGFSFVF